MKLSYILIFLFSTQMVLSQVHNTVTTKSGFNYHNTDKGEGGKIYTGTVVIQHYTLGLSNGEKLVSSRGTNEPFLDLKTHHRLIKGTNEVPSLRSLGDRGIFIMPYYLAYAEKGDFEVLPKKH